MMVADGSGHEKSWSQKHVHEMLVMNGCGHLNLVMNGCGC